MKSEIDVIIIIQLIEKQTGIDQINSKTSFSLILVFKKKNKQHHNKIHCARILPHHFFHVFNFQ